MREITAEAGYDKKLKEVYVLMSKGEENLTDKDAQDITAMARAIQEYENSLSLPVFQKPLLE